MLSLAEAISKDIQVVGPRPGEKLDEDLVSESELPYTYVDGDFISIRKTINEHDNRLDATYNSQTADKMTYSEMRDLIGE